LIEWLFHQVGIPVPDGSYNQAKVVNCVPTDKLLIGDLAFKWCPETEVIHHVGVYIGEGRILEAKGKAYGVVITDKILYEASNHFAFYGRLKIIEDA
jgi:cell wall-associated NlpC family hydrolase